MDGTGLGLRRRPADETVLEPLLLASRRVPLLDLPRRRARRAHWARPPAPHAVAGFTWDLRDRRALHWWPQGVDVIAADGGRPPLLAVSWFSQRGRASRLSLIDLRPTAPRYWHVDLVAASAEGWTGVETHAGGVAVIGDRIYVAATHGGLLEFGLDGMLEHGGRLALPQIAELRPSTAKGAERMRYSFVSLESSATGGEADRLGLVVGEWRPERGGRLARSGIHPGKLLGGNWDEVHDPGIPAMQGAQTSGGTWFVTSSRGDRENGDLWVGERDALVRLPGELAPGPEDVCLWAERGQLWNVSEFPGKRWVYALDAVDVTHRAARAAAAAR